MPPSADQMIAQIRADFTSRIDSLEKLIRQSKTAGRKASAPPTAFEIAHRQALKDQDAFEKLMASVPKGFRLTPVLYSRITPEQNAEVFAEYNKRVRPDFLHYLAHNHAAELSALGICQHGIDRMKKGLDPADASGSLYSLNIDHIVERAGGGNWSLQKAVDPQMPAGSPPTFLVNHFSNFILLPKKIHNYKNDLNALQKASFTPYGESRWVLMLVPETGPGQSAYIAPPQDQQHPLHGVHTHRENGSHYIQHAEFMVDRTRDALSVFRQDPVVAGILKTAEGTGTNPRQAFNDAVSQHPTQKDRLETFVKPAMQETLRWLTLAFNDVSKTGKITSKSFLDFYQGRKVSNLPLEMADLPCEETEKLRDIIQQIDTALLQARFNKQAAPPVNDNKAPAVKRKQKSHRRKNGSHKRRRHYRR